MVLPLVVGGVMAAGAIAQYLNSREAARLSAQERARLQEMLSQIQSPNFDPATLTPEQYKVVAKYVPQAADFVAEQAPQLTKMDSADARMSRDAQREALSRLRAQAQGQDPLAGAELQDALAQASVANRGRVQAVREDFARRGQGGGTAEMLAQLLGTQQANEAASTGSRQAFIEAQRRKLQSLRDSSSLAGAIRDDEFRLERGNNDIINSFNQRTATRQQAWGDRSADIANEGQRFNIQNEQDVANRNTGASNEFAVRERDRGDRLAQQGFSNEMAKFGQQVPVSQMARDDYRSDARDKNSAISGVTSAVATGAGYYGAGQQAQAQAPRSASDSLTAQPTYSAWNDDPNDPLRRQYGRTA